MNPGNYTMRVRQGDSFALLVTLGGVDLTGCEAQLGIHSANTGAVLAVGSLVVTANGSKLTTAGSAGTVAVALSVAETKSLSSGTYELKVKFADGSILTYLAGQFEVCPEVTPWST